MKGYHDLSVQEEMKCGRQWSSIHNHRYGLKYPRIYSGVSNEALRRGALSVIYTSFSFSHDTAKRKGIRFPEAANTSRVCFRARDDLSLRDVSKMVQDPTVQVKGTRDIVFTLKPTKVHPWVGVMEAFIGREKAAGRVVVGMNCFVYPEIRKMKWESAYTKLFGEQVCKLAREQAVSVMFVPHDFRNNQVALDTSNIPYTIWS